MATTNPATRAMDLLNAVTVFFQTNLVQQVLFCGIILKQDAREHLLPVIHHIYYIEE